MRRPAKSRAPLLVAAGLLAALLAAAAVCLLLRKEPQTATSTEPRDKPAVATDVDVAQLRTECSDLEKTEFWKELKECADRLKPVDPELGDKLWKKADDEAANEKRFKGLQDYIEKKDFEKARVQMKLIENSVYTERAHKLLEEAEGASKQ